MVAVLRAGHVIVPRGETILDEGDEVVVLTLVEVEDEVRHVLVG